MLWLERKYVNQLSPYLRNFKWKKPTQANCSCPICGDSNSNKLKARFYFLERKGHYHVFCHNCGYSRKFTSFLRDQNNELYNEYVKELVLQNYVEKTEEKQDVSSSVVKANNTHVANPLSYLKSVTQYPNTHIAKQYCLHREIPKDQLHRLYYAADFMNWVNTIIPGKFIYTKDEPRLVIPMFKQNGEMFAFQGRSLDPESKLRYITITIDYDVPKLFGMEQVDMNKRNYVLEGPIDSLFIKNSIAMAGSDVEENTFINQNSVFVLDNEPRNKHVVSKYSKLIKNGHKICIWPKYVTEKDINDMILQGRTSSEIMNIIDQHNYSGLDALIHLNEWKRS